MCFYSREGDNVTKLTWVPETTIELTLELTEEEAGEREGGRERTLLLLLWGKSGYETSTRISTSFSYCSGGNLGTRLVPGAQNFSIFIEIA